MIGDRGNSVLRQKLHGFLDARDRGRIDDHVAARVVPQRAHQQLLLFAAFALLHDVAQIRAMKAGDVLVRIAQAQLLDDVVPHAAGGAGGERRERPVGEMQAQSAQAAGIRGETRGPIPRCSALRRWRKMRRERCASHAGVSARASRSGER